MAALPWKDGKRPPPVKDRPKCAYWGKPLRPHVSHIWEKQTDEQGTRCVPVAKEFAGYGDGFFCGPLHGYKWAVYTLQQILDGVITVRRQQTLSLWCPRFLKFAGICF